MDLAITLVIQGVVFFLVAWGVMKFIWPSIIEIIEARQKKIADGLAAASKGEKELGEAEARSKEIICEARDRAARLVEQAGKRSNEIVEEAKGTASSEAQRLVAQAHDEVSRETTRAREGLRQEVGRLAVEGASRLLGREIDAKTHAELLDKLAAEVANG
jgi:F-type H+-transporting ATPase subunit b